MPPSEKQVTVSSRTMRTRREILRRHRRERQFLVFGLLLVTLGALAVIALAVYQGRIDPPIDRAIVSHEPEFELTVTLPCPPADEGNGEDLPLPPTEVAIRVLNGTDKQGLARGTMEVLTGRGYVPTTTTNWNRKYDGGVRVQFGVDGLRKAYTVAANFPTVEFMLDNRKGGVVDVILGEQFEIGDIRPQYAPELDPTVPLTAPGQCVPVELAPQQPAPRIIPVDPLAPIETPTPTPSPEPEA